ncbi:MAG: CHAT domain-containing protein [Bacteroidota bacterium]
MWVSSVSRVRVSYLIFINFLFGQISAQSPLLERAVLEYKAEDLLAADSLLDLARPLYSVDNHPDSCAFVALYTAEVAYELGDEARAATLFMEAENVAQQYIESPEQLDFYYRILQGRVATLNDIDEKDAYRQLVADQVLTHQSDQAEPMADAYQALAWIAWNQYQYGLAIARLDTAVQFGQEGYTPSDLGQAHANLSSAYYVAGDEERALINQQLATLLSSQPDDQAINLLHEGESMIDLRRFNAADDRFRQAEEIIEASGIEDDIYRQLLCFRMQLANELEDWATYDENLDRLGESFERLSSPTLSNYYDRYFLYGASRAIRDLDFAEARNWLAKYQQAFQSGLIDNSLMSSYQFLKSKELAATGQFDEAIEMLAKTIQEANEIANDNHLEWTINDFYIDNQTIIWIKDLASYYLRWYNQSVDESYIPPATHLLDLADNLISYARSLNYQFGNRIELNEIAKESASLRMSIYRRQYLETQEISWAERAFQASAGVKQRWVSDRRRDFWLRSQMDVDEELLNQQEELFTALAEQMRLAEGILTKPEVEELENIRIRVDSLRHLQSILEQEIQSNHPEYANERYKTPGIALDSIRESLLETDEVLVQFFEIDTAVYTLVVTPDTLHFSFLPLSQPLSERMPRLVSQLDDRALDEALFLELHSLYKEIIDPILPQIGQSDLLVIPDGYLWYLPINGLITELASSSPAHYFAHSYMIQDRRSRFHLNSLLAWLSSKDSPSSDIDQSDVQAFCPMGDSGLNQFSALPMSASTAQMLTNRLSISRNQIRMNEEATEASVVRAASMASVLHLGTHAEIAPENPDYSFLQLYPSGENDGRLFAHELSEMPSDVALAVLMACRTADGKLYRGQGVANLGRDMMRGGTKGLMLNRWRVSDDMSRRLMDVFYPALLLDGLPPADALRRAQLEQLSNEATAHPSDWATAFYIGRNSPIKLSRRSNYWYFPLLLLGIIVGVIYKRFKAGQ